MTGYTALVTSDADGADGTHTLTVFGRTGVVPVPTGAPVYVPLAGLLPDEALGDASPGFGGGLIGREQPTVWDDADGILTSLLDGIEDEADLILRVSGPDGRGGVYVFEGTPIAADEDGPTAPVVYAPGRLAVTWRCGIGRASDVTMPPATGDVGENLMRSEAARPVFALAGITPHDVVTDLGVFPTTGSDVGEATDGNAWRVIHYGLWDNDANVEDALTAVAALHSLSVYLSAHDLSGDGSPRWHAVPRWRQGTDFATTLTPRDADVDEPLDDSTYPETLTGETVTLGTDRLWDARPTGYGRRSTPREIRLTSDEPVQLVRDAEFATYAGGDTDYWGASYTPVTGFDSGVTLAAGSGAAVFQPLIALSAGARLRTVTRRGATLGGTSFGVVRVSLRTAGGTVLWADATGWGTTPVDLPDAPDPATSGITPTPSRMGTDFLAITPPLPEAGVLTLHVLASGATDAYLYAAAAYAADGAGLPVTAFTGALAGAGRRGDAAEIPLPARSEALGTTRDEVLRWTSPAEQQGGTPGVYDSLAQAALAERLAQSGRGGTAPEGAGERLRTIAGIVPGLCGPDTRLTFATVEPFDVDPMTAVFVGGTVSRVRGVTDGVWCEVTTAGLTETSSRPAVDLTYAEASL